MKRTPLKRGASLERRTPVKKVNRKRAAKKYERNFGDKAVFVRTLPCILSGVSAFRCRGDVQACHTKSRGAGGSAKDLVPMCQHHHEMQHTYGIVSFEYSYGIDLHAEAERIEARWLESEEA